MQGAACVTSKSNTYRVTASGQRLHLNLSPTWQAWCGSLGLVPWRLPEGLLQTVRVCSKQQTRIEVAGAVQRHCPHGPSCVDSLLIHSSLQVAAVEHACSRPYIIRGIQDLKPSRCLSVPLSAVAVADESSHDVSSFVCSLLSGLQLWGRLGPSCGGQSIRNTRVIMMSLAPLDGHEFGFFQAGEWECRPQL